MIWNDETRQAFQDFLQFLENKNPLPKIDTNIFYQEVEEFYHQLIETNTHTNLTRITSPEGFVHRHILDSLTLLPYVKEQGQIMDIGCGGGFPCIPLALYAKAAKMEIHITGVESVGKKCRFMESVIQAQGLEGYLSILEGRAEILGQDPKHREQHDLVTARAVASLPTLLELCLPFVKSDGLFVALKGPQYKEEWDQSAKALEALKGKLKEIKPVESSSGAALFLLVFEKSEATPRQYPRKVGIPSKKPL